MGKKFNIFILINFQKDCLFLKQSFNTSDFNVQIKSDIHSSLDEIKKGNADLLFIDSSIDKSNGVNSCSYFRSDPQLKDFPIIVLIQGKNPALVQSLYFHGADDVIPEPFVESELSKKALTYIELKYTRRMSSDINSVLENKIMQRTLELEESLEKLKLAKKEMDSLDIAKTEFLNLISHEIRTPLNGVLGSLALIERYDFTDEVKDYLYLLEISVKRLESFSNTILEASNLRLKGRKALTISNVKPLTLLNAVINDCMLKYKEKKIKVLIKDELFDQKINADQKYLARCLDAIMDNAFKFSPESGRVEVMLTKNSGHLLSINISDSGPGFSKTALENIFTPLSNLSNHFDKNTGMGLHLAKLIIEAHSGTISVNTKDPHGSEIKITLPLS